jgi:hypothetical protein
MKESQEGYGRLGVQVADLITAVASVLQQTKQNEAFERVLQANVKGLFEYFLFALLCVRYAYHRATRVLQEIDVAVKKRLSSQSEHARKPGGLLGSIRQKTKDVKRRYKDPAEIEEMRQKLDNIVKQFTVSGSLKLVVTRAAELTIPIKGIFSPP